MKRKITISIISLFSVFCLLLSGCDINRISSAEPLPTSSKEVTGESESSSDMGTLSEIPNDNISSNNNVSSNIPVIAPVTSKLTLKAVWIEYTDAIFQKNSKENYIKLVTERFGNVEKSGFNAIFFHVRANADAIYKSDYFPYSDKFTGKQGTDPGYDALEIAIDIAHNFGLELHAWVNPYRISASSSDITRLSENNIARIWRTDGNPETDSYVIPWNNKLYFNPSVSRVQKLIIDGIREILDNYDVDGIHFDDYFYPTSDTNFDIGSYAKYCMGAKYPLSQGDWRRANVDTLVSNVYNLTRSYNKPFGISPAYSISNNNTDRNYNSAFINLKKWLSNKGYVDYLLPQLYFGYEHKLSTARFDYLLDLWCSMKKSESVKLYIGLPAYKIGLKNDADLAEWADKTDILARQYADCYDKNVDGISIYNYTSFFSDAVLNKAQRENFLKEMNGE